MRGHKIDLALNVDIWSGDYARRMFGEISKCLWRLFKVDHAHSSSKVVFYKSRLRVYYVERRHHKPSCHYMGQSHASPIWHSCSHACPQVGASRTRHRMVKVICGEKKSRTCQRSVASDCSRCWYDNEFGFHGGYHSLKCSSLSLTQFRQLVTA